MIHWWLSPQCTTEPAYLVSPIGSCLINPYKESAGKLESMWHKTGSELGWPLLCHLHNLLSREVASAQNSTYSRTRHWYICSFLNFWAYFAEGDPGFSATKPNIQRTWCSSNFRQSILADLLSGVASPISSNFWKFCVLYPHWFVSA
jgi:hypothetical protein